MIDINKKLTAILVTLILIMFVIVSKDSFTSGEKKQGKEVPKKDIVSVFLNDKLLKFSQNPVVENKRVYVPTEEFAKEIGAKAKLKGSKKIIIKKDNKSLVINKKESTMITEDDKSISIKIINEGKESLLPIDIISKHFGFSISPLSNNSIKIYDKAHDIDEPKYKELKSEKVDATLSKEKEASTKTDKDAGKKIAYLTFDDGPNAITPQILDVLKEKNVKATFFMLGSSILEHGDTTKRISKEGHGMGVHSMTHQFKSVYASPESFLKEMTAANDALYAETGKKTTVLRAPYGSKPYMKQETRDLTAHLGYRIWDWNVDSRDSIKKNTTPDEVYNEVVNQTADKNKAVILFHDKEHTLKALPRIIDYLTSNGFEIRKIDKDLAPLNFWNDQR